MRCPKCGYISFDHMETCLKCKKDISGKVDVVGTTYHAAAPSFLASLQKDRTEDAGGIVESESEQAEDVGIEFSDPDLEVLAEDSDGFSFEEEDDAEDDISFDSFESDDVKAEFQIEADEDFDDDDDSFEFELEGDDESDTAGFDVPDELSDISDLAPPASDGDQIPAEDGDMSLSLDDDMSLGDDLDLDGLDLNLGLGDDDTDISKNESSGTDGDDSDDFDDLSMDLDLGGLGDEEPKPKREKSMDGLDDITLSLD